MRRVQPGRRLGLCVEVRGDGEVGPRDVERAAAVAEPGEPRRRRRDGRGAAAAVAVLGGHERARVGGARERERAQRERGGDGAGEVGRRLAGDEVAGVRGDVDVLGAAPEAGVRLFFMCVGWDGKNGEREKKRERKEERKRERKK